MPQNPEAWLLTTARHSLIDLIRHQQVVLASEPTLLLLREEFHGDNLGNRSFRMNGSSCFSFVPTRRLIRPCIRLLCSRPSLVWMRRASPGAFLILPTTMGQRLVRAKTKIRDGGIRFEIPQEHELPQRLDAVLEAIYAAFGIGWDDMAGVDQRGRTWPKKQFGSHG